MTPIQTPREWDDRGLITFEEFCTLIRTPPRTVHDWRQRGVGPRWAKFDGCGRLCLTVAEARRFGSSALANERLAVRVNPTRWEVDDYPSRRRPQPLRQAKDQPPKPFALRDRPDPSRSLRCMRGQP